MSVKCGMKSLIHFQTLTVSVKFENGYAIGLHIFDGYSHLPLVGSNLIHFSKTGTEKWKHVSAVNVDAGFCTLTGIPWLLR